MAYRIIALDPGGTTGWATYTADKMVVTDTERKEWYKEEFFNENWACGQLGPEPHHNALWAFLELQEVSETVIVCESFEFRQDAARKRNNLVLTSLEYIGIAKLFSSQRDNVQLVMQTAAKAKGFCDDKKLQKLGLFQTPKTTWPHANDAYRHLLTYMIATQGRRDLVERLR